MAFLHGLGAAANFTGGKASSIAATGLPLDLSVLTFGPRYRWHASRRLSVCGEGVVGYAHGYNSEFPTADAPEPSASSFALQLGAGADYRLTKHPAVRGLDIGWLRTQLPNGTDNIQNHLRIGGGVVLRFGNT